MWKMYWTWNMFHLFSTVFVQPKHFLSDKHLAVVEQVGLHVMSSLNTPDLNKNWNYLAIFSRLSSISLHETTSVSSWIVPHMLMNWWGRFTRHSTGLQMCLMSTWLLLFDLAAHKNLWTSRGWEMLSCYIFASRNSVILLCISKLHM
jgi:hypothetical protein